MKHKHCDLIKAWAEGAKIQVVSKSIWRDTNDPQWFEEAKYRIKPDSSEEPIRAWANVYGDSIYVDNDKTIPDVDATRCNVPLIEAGYCQLIPHYESAECSYDHDSPIIVRYTNGAYKVWDNPVGISWLSITHYAVILPVE